MESTMPCTLTRPLGKTAPHHRSSIIFYSWDMVGLYFIIVMLFFIISKPPWVFMAKKVPFLKLLHQTFCLFSIFFFTNFTWAANNCGCYMLWWICCCVCVCACSSILIVMPVHQLIYAVIQPDNPYTASVYAHIIHQNVENCDPLWL